MKLNQKKIEEFCKKYHIVSMALFGSILTHQFGPASDVDFLVKFEKEYTPTLFGIVEMESELTDIIGRHADLKTANELSSYFRNEVLAQAKVIYAKS